MTMAGFIAPNIVNSVIDAVFRGYNGGIAFSLPSNLYLALLVAEPYLTYDDMLFFDSPDEVTYTGYARRTIARSLAGFLSTQGDTAVSSGSSGTTRPAANQYFPLCTTSSQVVTHAALTDSSTRFTTENLVICYWELPRPMQLSNTSPGYYPCLYAAGLTLRLDD